VSAPSEPASPASPDPEPSVHRDADAYAEIFDAHAAHLFDYCNRLLGDEAEAASATELALTTAQSLLQDGERLRAWLFALARRECLNVNPAGADGLGYAAPTELGEDLRDADTTVPDLGRTASRVVRQVLPPFGALADQDREVLDLVYRHGIRPEDLPAILGVSADHALELLTAAEAEFSRSANPATAGEGDASVEQIAELPLAALPASVWRHTVGAVPDADLRFSRWEMQLAESEPTKARRRPAALPAQARRRLRVGAVLLLPAAATVAAVIYFLGPSPSRGVDHGTANSPRTATAGPSGVAANGPVPVPGSSSPQIRALVPSRAKNPVGVVLPPLTSSKPAPSKTAKPKPKPSASSSPTSSPSTSASSTPTSPSPSASPSASPSSTSPSTPAS
jgi:DNA-directed RNA polymerase specialized sigma24 family protein